MLSSSDAKWRCMWHMFVWSVLMTLVSQFLDIRDHFAFFFFAAVAMLVMPVLTAVYSNSSGRHCAGLLRAGYVFCDPVLVCITITPVQLLSRLPKYLDEYFCMTLHEENWNRTLDCLQNKSWMSPLLKIHHVDNDLYQSLVTDKHERILVIQGCLVAPILLSLFMGRRSRKMAINTYIFTSAYWLIAAIEASDVLETALISKVYKHTIFTTEAIVSIVMIITNAYAIVTLCSFLTPSSANDGKRYDRKFDLVYQCFVGVAGIFFVELPMLVARFQIIGTDTGRVIHGSFYMWIAKDIIFVFLIIIILVHQKLRKNYAKYFKGTHCRAPFDNPSVSFEPEKRDVYIHQKKVRFQKPPISGMTAAQGDSSQLPGSILRKKAVQNKTLPALTVEHSVGSGSVGGTPEPNSVYSKDQNALLPITNYVPSIVFTPVSEVGAKSRILNAQVPSTTIPCTAAIGTVPLTHIPPQAGGVPPSHYTTAATDKPELRLTFTTADDVSISPPVKETRQSPLSSTATGGHSSPETTPVPKVGGISPSASVLKKPDLCNDPPTKKRKTLPKKVSFRSATSTPYPIVEENEYSDSDSSDEDEL